MIIYFSGTGNSRFAAEVLAKALQDQIIDAGKLIKAGESGQFESTKPWVFVAPTYSWRMPRIFSEFIGKIHLSGSKEAYFVLTCGGEIGEAGKYARNLCLEKGLQYQGTLQVPMPENFITMFNAPDPSKIKDMIADAKNILVNASEAIRQGTALPEHKCGILDKLKSGPVNEGFNRFFLKSTGFYATDRCISCGKCVKLCVLNNIRLVDGKPVWGENCTQCMACICCCPQEAIEYGKRTQGKVRYYCPETDMPV